MTTNPMNEQQPSIDLSLARESACPCCSNTLYRDCCELVHLNHANADHPEKLMRSRYSAHALGLVDFVIDTYHPSCEAEKHRDAIAQSVNSEWLGLEVIASSVEAEGNLGYVQFKAHYAENGNEYCLQEKSRFVTEKKGDDTVWYYLDGEYPQQQKVGRNDPCPCGSGKKHKKCCG
ncbi:YchJ family metal-binding protein [Enterovibrio norvegicus]|uniref:YchJ family metal-binding protein n=1 Tax=Enterovibrio norvegicus TaxID=188144 RepID=UPI000C8348B0|nr:YchJ family metal-binding protein [Enterovibrio norvegicus]